MANSSTNLDIISASQSNKEVSANSLFDAASPAMLYGRRAVTTAALTWGYFGGTLLSGSSLVAIANGTLSLSASATNYVEADGTTGAVSVNTTGFTTGKVPLYQIATDGSGVTSYTDRRAVALAGNADAAITAHLAAADPHPQYLTQAEGDTRYAGAGSGGVTSVNTKTGAVTLTAADVGADASGAASSAVSAHAGATDPHPQYLTQTEGDARYQQSIGSQPFDLTAFYPGVPPASVKVTRVPFARAVSFPANFSGSVGIASVAATASTVFDVRKNGASVGSITFAAGSATATFTTSGAISMAAGDYLSIWTPGTPDATLADPGFVLAGSR